MKNFVFSPNKTKKYEKMNIYSVTQPNIRNNYCFHLCTLKFCIVSETII